MGIDVVRNLIVSAARFRSVVWVLLLALALPVTAQQQGILNGLILDPAGNPAADFRLVFKSETDGKEYTTDPSDALGKYSINLPAMQDYVLIAAVAPDGTRMQVPPLPALPVEPGARRVDVKFGEPEAGQPAAGATGKKQAATAASAKGPNWWMIGGAAAAVVVVVLLVGGNDSEPEQPASGMIP